MSFTDTSSAKKYASIAEIAAAQAKLYANKLESAPDYAEQAAASASAAASSAMAAVSAESVVNNLAISASESATDAAASAAEAGNAAAAAVGQCLRVPVGELIDILPAAVDRADSLVQFDSSGQVSVLPKSDIAILDSGGKIPVSMIPAIALTEPFVVSSQAAMLALDAQVGDIAKRTDLGYSFCLAASPASTLSNWVQLTDDVLAQLGLPSGATQVGATDDSGSNTTVQGALGLKASLTALANAISSVFSDFASTAVNKGAYLLGVKQPFTGAVSRTQADINADMVLNVKDFGGIGNGSSSSAADIAAVQAAINALAPMTTPVRVKIPRGTWSLSGIVIPRRGVVIDLTEAVIEAGSGSVFTRIFPQLAAADFKAAYPALDGNQTYFRPIVIKGGTVNLSGTATFLEIRQPYLAEYSIWGKTLIIDDTQIKTYGTSIAFAIHGGWGFDFNSVAVTGDVTAPTGYGASVGSGTCLYSRPDNSLNGSSHPQLISFNSCTISYCKVFDMARGSSTGGSAEGLYLNNTNCMFVEGGMISRINLVEFNNGMFVTVAKELYFEACAGVMIDGMQVQRYNNPRSDSRYGEFQFIGGGSEIKITNCRALAGGGVTGTMFGFRAGDAEEFLDVQIANIQYVGEITNVNETDQTKTTSVVRTISGGTGKITGMTINNVSARGVHNILDFGDLGTTGSINRLELKSIRNIGSSVKQRARGLNENISNIYAPEMYAVNFIRMRAGAVGNTATICSYENFRTQITGSTLPVASISNNAPVSNAVSISFSSWDNAGNVILALNQVAGLTNGNPVECTATLTLNTSSGILA